MVARQEGVVILLILSEGLNPNLELVFKHVNIQCYNLEMSVTLNILLQLRDMNVFPKESS